jgi:glycosyltransferase involved in cell wall biosynthesis
VKRRKIAYIRPGNSPSNQRFASVLSAAFPEFQVDILDGWSKKDWLTPLNVFAALAQRRALPVLTRDKEIWANRLSQTSYLFQKTRESILQRVNPDEYLFTFQIQSMFDASIPGLPHFLYTDHTALANLEYPEFDAASIDPRWIELEKTIYQHADINFVRSTNIRRSIMQDYACPPEKVAIVYAGSNAGIDPHKQVDPAKYHSKNILFVGVDWPRKGGPQLVEAFKRVLQVHPDAHLTIVGCWPQVDVPNCTVVGKLSVSELAAYYDRAAVFCMPTRREPFGIVFIEAFSNKLPIVATRLGAIPDFVLPGESGYLVDPTNNIEQLAEALSDLLGDPAKCQALGERGYQIALERYTWQHTGRLIREHVVQCVGAEHFAQEQAAAV